MKDTMTLTWRQRLKSGPLQGVYAVIRRAKRRLRNEPLSGNVPFTPTPLAVSELLALMPDLADQPRVYFSLAVGYLEQEADVNLRKAAACLRCAETLEFESIERIRLYQAVIAAKRGRKEEAERLLEPFPVYLFTKSEQELREKVLQGALPIVPEAQGNTDWQNMPTLAEQNGPEIESLIVVADENAESSEWFLGKPYLLASSVTGLTPAAVARLDRKFSIGFGTKEAHEAAVCAGVKCDRWVYGEQAKV